MKFMAVTGALLVALCILPHLQTTAAMMTTSPPPVTATVYEPECESLDAAIQTIQDSSSSLYSTMFGMDPLISCTTDAECDGFRCNITLFQGGKFLLAVELRPCQDPPQMLVLITNPDTNMKYVEQTVTHGDSFTIPGLEYSYLGFIRISVELRVQFQQVPGGLQIGLSLACVQDLIGDVLELPLLPSTVINTPPCSTEGPSPPSGASVQCVRMQTLVDSLHPPNDFICTKKDDCKGFRCRGSITGIPITAEATIDSCTRPVSMTITIYDGSGKQVWSHVFTQSENVRVEGDDVNLPPGVTANLDVMLEPYTMDIDYLITTIELTICMGTMCQSEKFIDHGFVPIPPCDNPPTSTVSGPTVMPTPRPGSDTECLTWVEVSNRVMQSGIFDENDVSCMANEDCDGITCDMVVLSRPYLVDMKLFHCETPVHLRFKMNSTDDYNYGLAKNITQENSKTPVSIDGVVGGGQLKFYLAKRSDTSIELAILLRLLNPDNPQHRTSIPLVEDHIIPVKKCPATLQPDTIPPIIVTMPSSPGMKPVTLQPDTIPPIIVTMTSSPGMKSATKPGPRPSSKPGPHPSSDPGSSKNRNGPKKHKSPKSNGVAIGIGSSVAAVVAAIIIIIAVLWFRRRSRSPNDHIALVEDDAPITL